jgi:hypothetical protein
MQEILPNKSGLPLAISLAALMGLCFFSMRISAEFFSHKSPVVNKYLEGKASDKSPKIFYTVTPASGSYRADRH